MKYYVVPSQEIIFKQNEQVVAPTKEVVEQNIAAMFDEGKNSSIGFDNIEDAISLANEYDPDKKDGEGFLILEVEAPKKKKKDDAIDLHLDENKIESLKGFTINLKNATFVQAHLEHLDPTLKDSNIELNMKGAAILKKVAAKSKVSESEPEEKTEASDNNEAPSVADDIKPAVSRFRTAMRGVLVTGALAATATAATVSGLTPALLAYAGIKLSFAATLAASAVLSTVAITAAYGVMKGASKFAGYVSSKRNAAAPVVVEEAVAEDAVKDTTKAEVAKDTAAELKPAEEKSVEEVVKEAEAVSDKNVLQFSGARASKEERKENTQAEPTPESASVKQKARK